MKSIIQNSWLTILLLIVVVCVVYANTLHNQFVWDDKTFADWNLIRDIRHIPEILKGTLPGAHQGDYRPLKGLILMLDYHLWGLHPAGYHIQAIFIHCINTILVYLVLRLISRSNVLAFIAGLLFAVHPANVEAITFITSSTDMVGVSFFLTSFYMFLKFMDTSRRKWQLVSLLFAATAFVAYEMTLTLPILLGLYLLCFKKTWPTATKIGTIAPYWVILIAYLVFRFGFLGLRDTSDTYLLGSPYFSFLAVSKALLVYITILFYPVMLTVNHTIPRGILSLTDVDLNEQLVRSQSVSELQFVLAWGIVLACILFAAKAYRRSPMMTFGISWFLIALLPVSQVIPLSALMSERYLYIPQIGIWILLGFIFNKLAKFHNSLIVISLVLLLPALGILGYLTVRRNADWRDSKTLWTKTLATAPTSALAHHNLGIAYFDEGKALESIPYLEYAASHNPKKVARIHYNLAKAYIDAGRENEAGREFLITIDIDPLYTEAHVELGNLYKKAGNINEAKKAYQAALEVNPEYYDAMVNLATLLYGQGRHEESESLLTRAIQVGPDYIPAYVNLATIYIKQKKLAEAKLMIDKGLQLQPDNQDLKSLLAKMSGPRQTD